jgi:hypothetical protein
MAAIFVGVSAKDVDDFWAIVGVSLEWRTLVTVIARGHTSSDAYEG